jgi:hypothetical protein
MRRRSSSGLSRKWSCTLLKQFRTRAKLFQSHLKASCAHLNPFGTHVKGFRTRSKVFCGPSDFSQPRSTVFGSCRERPRCARGCHHSPMRRSRPFLKRFHAQGQRLRLRLKVSCTHRKPFRSHLKPFGTHSKVFCMPSDLSPPRSNVVGRFGELARCL